LSRTTNSSVNSRILCRSPHSRPHFIHNMHAMSEKLTRRDVLIGAATVAAATVLSVLPDVRRFFCTPTIEVMAGPDPDESEIRAAKFDRLIKRLVVERLEAPGNHRSMMWAI
jgi:hypothetical protein